jgi:hypothetical protein
MLSKQAKKIFNCIGNWYFEENHTYLRIYGAIIPPHLLLVYVPDKLVIREIFYHTII